MNAEGIVKDKAFSSTRFLSKKGNLLRQLTGAIFILIFRSGTLSDAALVIARSQLVGLKAEAKLMRITIARTVLVRVGIFRNSYSGRVSETDRAASAQARIPSSVSRDRFRRLELTPLDSQRRFNRVWIH